MTWKLIYKKKKKGKKENYLQRKWKSCEKFSTLYYVEILNKAYHITLDNFQS